MKRLILLMLLTCALGAAPSRYAGVPFPSGGVDGVAGQVSDAGAAEGPGLVRTAFSLAAVLGLVVGLAWCYRKATGTKTTFKSGVATVVGRAAVSPKHGVVLVKVGRRVLVCGEAAGQPLTKLDVITDADEIAELVGTSATADRPFVSELADAGETYPEPADADVPPTEPQPQDAASELRTLISRIGQTTGVAKT